MDAKPKEHKLALILRKRGFSYSEIIKKIKVSRSTLSSWLRNTHITNSQIERLRMKNFKARNLCSLTLKKNRIEKTKRIIKNAKVEIKEIDLYHLKIIGSILYWAEGSKQKEYNPSKELVFNNSDPAMIKVYLSWINKCLKIKNEDIKFEIYIHETYNRTRHQLVNYWSKVTLFPVKQFPKIYFKKNKVNSGRRNRGNNYFGVLRITVKRSTDLNRKVIGWIEGICNKVDSI